MKSSEITINIIRNMDPLTRKLFDIARTMTPKQLDLLIEIIDLTTGRPDRLDYALSYTGNPKDLPAVLAQI